MSGIEKNNKTINIRTLGCKLNFAESATIEQHLAAQGFAIVQGDKYADVYIINTCAVTETAEKKCRQLINHLHLLNPAAKIVLVGCYSALEQSQKLASEVDLILGSHNKMQILNCMQTLFDSPAVPLSDTDSDTFFSSYSLHERTRSFLKIQDGCDYHCSYCTVCIARGKSRSDSIDNVVNNAKTIVTAGIKEIVLSGVNIGDFKADRKPAFLELLQHLVTVEGLERIRISSIEPNLLSNEIIRFAAEHRQILPHFHIPLQSGNNRILGLMRRRYQRELFADKALYIKQLMPHACIAADVIVGFPTETDDDFDDTYRFIAETPINMLHVFPYSRRPHTIANQMEGQIEASVKNARTKRLIALSDTKKQQFYAQHQGLCFPVLIEHKKENNSLFGFTDNYIKVRVDADSHLEGQIINAQLIDTTPDGIYNIKIV